ncbi:4'-phosphopantetheinyl transferase family protein [Herbiconiux daphne]|uniref:Uncharacterized protein n=1 Tax=Herbiconiux daphne TaxID=2970914 RepID=A0ABT2H2D2_9MICO|nr:hypothetical protein [Herbiconiux daphne]MCS5734106.1 hypothetical protein [Herbiconiux daphne]
MTPRVHVRWIPLDAGAVDVAELLPVLGDGERRRFESTPDAATASRFVIGRAALRALASELVDDAVAPAELEVTAVCQVCGGPHGRPQVDLVSPKTKGKSRGKRLQASIAHCAAGVAVAASWHGAIGIDVERADAPIESLAAIGTLIPAAARPGGRNWEPIQHWTRVEAVVKADGRGLLIDPADVAIQTRDGAISATTPAVPETDVPGTAVPRFALADIRLDPAVRASVAVALRASATKPVVPLTSWRPVDLEQLRRVAAGAPV